MSWFDMFRYDSYDDAANAAASGGQMIQQPTTTSTTAPTTDYAKSNDEYEALFKKYQDQIDFNSPDSIQQLAAAMQRDGVPAELSKDGMLIRVPGYDGGWVDPRQDQAFVQGRGDIRGWAFQPYYGSEDFDRLVAEGRNPHTGEYVGLQQAQTYTRDSSQPGGGMPPGYSMQGANNLASFSAPGINAPWTQQFQAPTGTDDPGFQFALDRGNQAIQRSAAAKGTLLTGGTLRDIADYTTGMALQGYGDAWNRAFQTYGMDRDSFWGNQNNAYSRLSGLADLGRASASSYAGTAADLATNQGNVDAASTVAKANATGTAVDNIGQAIPSVWDAIKDRFGNNTRLSAFGGAASPTADNYTRTSTRRLA